MEKFPTPNQVRNAQELGDLKRKLDASTKPEVMRARNRKFDTRKQPRFNSNPNIKKEHKR